MAFLSTEMFYNVCDNNNAFVDSVNLLVNEINTYDLMEQVDGNVSVHFKTTGAIEVQVTKWDGANKRWHVTADKFPHEKGNFERGRVVERLLEIATALRTLTAVGF